MSGGMVRGCLRRAAVFSVVLSCVSLPTSAVEGSSQRYEFQQLHMGTRFRIVFYSPNPTEVNDAARDAFARIERLERILSSHREDSELRHVSARAFQGPQVLSRDLYSVLEMSLRFSRLSQGAFDITIHPFLQLWHSAREQGRLPDGVVVEQERRRVGYRLLLLNPRTRALRFRVPGVQLDLGGIGKGYAADEALKVLREKGISSALIDAGGDIRVGEPPPGRRGWTIELSDSSSPGHELLLSNCAIASSGDAFQYVEIDGIRYSHIIDPETGLGLQGARTVTLIAPRAAVADALATAVSVLGPDRGFAMIGGMHGVSAHYICHAKHGREERSSNGFPP